MLAGLNKNKKGFTLIELLVVVAIIGLLTTIAVFELTGTRTRSQDATRAADIRIIQEALEMYMNKGMGYPVTDVGECLQDDVGTGKILSDMGKVIGAVPEDPVWSDLEPVNFNDNNIKDYPITTSVDFCYWYYGRPDSYYLSYYYKADSKDWKKGIQVYKQNID